MDKRPFHHRVLALVALLALLAAFGVTAWWIVTDAIDLGDRVEPPAKGATTALSS